MTRKDKQYGDWEWFTFVPDKLTTQDAFSGYNYFPHHYRVQVKTTIIASSPDTCVALAVHVQDFEGRQNFDICVDGNWYYGHCDTQCKTWTQMDSGQLPSVKTSHLISMDVSANIIVLSIDNKPVASEHDSMYETTNQLGFSLYGNEDTKEVNTVLLSDFSYQPEP
ncbi:hypothetical protein [Ktedonobacter racemifer]|uniref:Uncharacterized protein n=1 Tax=Ktedonobacter racemifer DSM 44963 TaxID=485913 RepID=D6TZY6_KTERA|nr:hypothetical protein [Ktedonobacter racemifer]EFH82126.1 hypothetical protein Krac_2909 [Ktedonobacter racemifer DSM 44963]